MLKKQLRSVQNNNYMKGSSNEHTIFDNKIQLSVPSAEKVQYISIILNLEFTLCNLYFKTTIELSITDIILYLTRKQKSTRLP
jgi:hypothetical protein